MKTNYKEEQEKARQAWKLARRGEPVVCLDCDKGAEEGLPPFIKTDKGYQHKICPR